MIVALEPPQMQDDLKPRFARSSDDGPMKSFAPDKAPASAKPVAEAPTKRSNDQLLTEIRALQPEPKEPAPVKQPIDLNGIDPKFLLFGAFCYGVVAVLGWQFTVNTAQFFEDHPMVRPPSWPAVTQGTPLRQEFSCRDFVHAQDSAFYVVARLTAVARVALVAMGALGTGVTSIAAVGQIALAVQVVDGIRKGELDPNAERVDPYGGRKQGELEKMLRLMLGDKLAGIPGPDER
jgi:hypothetical protein